MGLFKLFDINSKKNAEVLPELTENTQGAENEETASPEEVKRDEKKIITITWGTGMLSLTLSTKILRKMAFKMH